MIRVKPLLSLAAILSILLPLLPAFGQQIGNIGYECQPGFGSEIVGIGSRSQTQVHYRVLINRFHAPTVRTTDGNGNQVVANYDGGCREDVQGLVGFQGEGDDAVIQAMRTRAFDALTRRFVYYGFSRPLTAVEKTRIETDAESLRPSLGNVVLQMPLWIEGVAIAYNLSCNTGNPNNALRLTSAALSQIFQGVITRWNDPAITVTNTGLLSGCDQTIRPAVRADTSDRTTVFRDYLSKRNPQWRPFLEPALNRQWPSTLLNPCKGRGDAGVATCVSGRPGAISYVSFSEALTRGLKVAQVENRSAAFVAPSLAACTEAGSLPSAGYPVTASGDWSGTSLTDQPVGYPVCSLQFVAAFQIMNFSYDGKIGVDKVRTVKDYLKWATLPATQAKMADLQLAKLPESLRVISRDGAESIRFRE